MTDRRWVLAYECVTSDGPARCCVPVGMPVRVGQSILVGREGDLPVGVEVYDRGVSRRAASVTATEHGWQVEILNTNGAVLHPWGQGPTLAGRYNSLSWPRIAIRILNGASPAVADTMQHWLLFESDSIGVTTAGARAPSSPTTSTFQPKRPQPLSPGQLEALQVVFADQLQWPPVQPAEPLLLRTAARRLGITESGVQERLSKAHARALHLGLHRAVGLTDPEYLYVLVRAGYVPLPARPPYRHQLR
jgi:hypothetical protein